MLKNNFYIEFNIGRLGKIDVEDETSDGNIDSCEEFESPSVNKIHTTHKKMKMMSAVGSLTDVKDN